MREPRPDWSSLGVNLKILDEHPHLFYIRVPPPPPPGCRLTCTILDVTISSRYSSDIHRNVVTLIFLSLQNLLMLLELSPRVSIEGKFVMIQNKRLAITKKHR